MRTSRWHSTLALPLVLLATCLPASARAASVKDSAGLFTGNTVNQALADLNRIERESKLPVTIETITSLNGEKGRDVLRRHARESGAAGLYVLIAKKEAHIEVEPQNRYRPALPAERTDAIRDAFVEAFKKRDFDGGLMQGVRTIGLEASVAQPQLEAIARGGTAPVAAAHRGLPPARVQPRANGGSFGVGSLLGIGLLIVGVLFVFRLLGSLFGASRGYGPGAPMMGRPGFGPGYGGGYGGGGGGFLSSLFGGIGGAMAGNWIYDQMSGRRHYGGENVENASYGGNFDPGPAADPNANDWTSSGSSGDWGGDSGGSSGGDWGGSSGGDWGGSSGGDWGGGGGGGSDGGW